MTDICPAALVIYKYHPARVEQIAEKIAIQLPDGKIKKVRPKDIQLIHPGPIQQLDDLPDTPADYLEAWELLQGTTTDLAELAELAYGSYTPCNAWMAWQILRAGLHFTGTPEAIQVQDTAQVAAILEQREQKRQAAAAWDTLLAHIQAATLDADERKRLAEVERVALGTSTHSPILRACKVPNTPQDAHQFLNRCGYWPLTENPWPRRAELELSPIQHPVPAVPVEQRLDLTHLTAWAIDDVGNQDPDDAISLDGDYLWVHIADVAALALPASPLDLAARARASNLYLPEHTHAMLPQAVVEKLGMGLAEQTPALSIGCRFDGTQLHDIQVVLSQVRVQRTTYDQVNTQLDQPEFAALAALTSAYRQRRFAQQATSLNLPDVSIQVLDDQVHITPLPQTPSRDLVADAMIMAGEAVAQYAQTQALAIPYAMQPAPDTYQQPSLLSEMYAYRRAFKPSRIVLAPEPHAGLGLASYTRCTSPLRRYADLIVHQQLRAHLQGHTPRDTEAINTALLTVESTLAVNRRTERQSNQHWKLVYLQQQPHWQGEGIIVALDERKATALIPSLAMETKLRRRAEYVLDAAITLQIQSVDIAHQEATFGVASR